MIQSGGGSTRSLQVTHSYILNHTAEQGVPTLRFIPEMSLEWSRSHLLSTALPSLGGRWTHVSFTLPASLVIQGWALAEAGP